MNIKSFCLRKESQALSELFHIAGALRTIIVISAYIDIESINQLIDFVSNGADSRGYPNLKVFIDKASSRFTSDRELRKKFLEADERISSICDSKSGIFLVQLGALFHSKAYLIEGNKKAKVLFGSMNLTQKALNGNEELVLFEDINIGGRAKGNRLAAWIKNYAEELHKTKSVKVASDIQGHFPSCMRQLLLDGTIYYEQKEQNPFRFKLYLPEEVAKQRAELDPLLEAGIRDSVSIEALITTGSPVGLGMKVPGLHGSKAFWKKFCIETCYGYWNPDYLKEDLQNTLKNRIKERKPHFDKIKRILHEKDREIRACFLGLCLRVQNHMEGADIAEWKYSSQSVADEAWNKWIENTKEKIENTEYYDRLVSGIANVPSPDVWNDPLASEEFEDSFCESLLYHWSKEYSKETSNVIAQSFAWNLDLGSDEKETLDKTQLRNLIDQWLVNNPGANIVCFNEE